MHTKLVVAIALAVVAVQCAFGQPANLTITPTGFTQHAQTPSGTWSLATSQTGPITGSLGQAKVSLSGGNTVFYPQSWNWVYPGDPLPCFANWQLVYHVPQGPTSYTASFVPFGSCEATASVYNTGGLQVTTMSEAWIGGVHAYVTLHTLQFYANAYQDTGVIPTSYTSPVVPMTWNAATGDYRGTLSISFNWPNAHFSATNSGPYSGQVSTSATAWTLIDLGTTCLIQPQ